jgi:16S rRNA (cytosine1402-N4)-methyltransferase
MSEGRDSTKPPGGSGAGDGPHKRRPRYAGKYPRRFEHRYKELNADAFPGIREHVRSQGRTPAGTHVPVLMREILDALAPKSGDIVADCTLGFGGHAGEFLRRISPGGKLVGFDLDEQQLQRTRQRLEAIGAEASMSLRHSNYAGLAGAMAEENIDGFDIVFADLGVSSMQVDDPQRGFSYKHENAPLDMRMDARTQRSAADVLASIDVKTLSDALWEYADEEDHDKIAQWIVQQRQVRPIARTGDLTRLILNAKGFSTRGRRKPWQVPGGLHPAAKTFQALRILVNDELGSLRQLLRVLPVCLKAGGRAGIISFHSGEDRLVKNAFREGLRSGVFEAASEDVIRPTGREVHDNPRSSSAKFRWARKAK